LKKFLTYLALLLLLLLIIIFAYALIETGTVKILIDDVIVISFVFALISTITVMIFHNGQKKETQSQVLYSLTAVSLKFLLEISFALIWFLLLKKNSTSSVVLFFILYLAFTLFSVFVILKTLKNKSLANKF
jgi:hypothetical protein